MGVCVCVCVTEVLRGLFDVLYDEEIISEEAFRRWQGSSDPAEQAGKGVAVRCVCVCVRNRGVTGPV